MSDTSPIIPYPPAARLFVSYVPTLMGFPSKKSTQDVLKEIRKQQTNVTKTTTNNQMIDTDTYWTIVGIIKDKFEEPKALHIDLLKTFIKDAHPDSWFDKLYDSMRISISNIDKPKTIEFPLGKKNNVILCGKPDIINGKTVIDIRNVTKFEETLCESLIVKLHCYMKITNLKQGIVRQICGTEHKDTIVKWNAKYWKKIERLVLAMLEWI
jgi:hypothetical protein